MAQLRHKISHIIFDLDGTLVDTEIIYSRCTEKILSRFNKKFDVSLKREMMGKPAKDAAHLLIERLNVPLTAEEYLIEREILQNELWATVEALPGAVSLVRHFHKHKIPIGIATSSQNDNYKRKTAHHNDWIILFNTIVVGDDPSIKKGKPEPDIFLETARRLGAKPENCLVFEDAIVGVIAAKRAGMKVIAIPDKRWNDDISQFSQADVIIDTLERFDPQPWGLPPM